MRPRLVQEVMQNRSRDDIGGGWSAFVYSFLDDFDAAVLFHMLGSKVDGLALAKSKRQNYEKDGRSYLDEGITHFLHFKETFLVCAY